ncbi:MAG: OmpA family protein [Bacteroidaceae bacterium]|nr:OmpA family protein [Bacteroidaceae bacterium]
MKNKIIFSVLITSLLLSPQLANAGFFGTIAKMFGVKEDSPIMTITETVDDAVNAAVAKRTNELVGKYGDVDDKERYESWAEEHNNKETRKAQEQRDAREQVMIDYCMQHGFYDSWYAQYGDNWFEAAGRDWFERYNEGHIRRTGESLIPSWLEFDYSPDYVESNHNIAMLNTLGLSANDLRNAEKWESSDKYGKREMIIDRAFGIVAEHSSNPLLTDGLKELAKANNNYLRDLDNNNPQAMTKRDLQIVNIVYESSQVALERKKEYNRQIKKIARELQDKAGYEDWFAEEIAGSVLAIQRDKSLTEDEKKELLRELGYYGHEDEVLTIAKNINNQDIEELRGPSPEEIEAERKRKEAEEKARLEKIAKERKEKAIGLVNNTVIALYDFDSSELTDEQKLSLDSISSVMNEYGDLKLTITGHTCKIGYKSINKKKGLKRADNAKSYLVDKGISEDRITTYSKGEEEPICSNDSKENRASNRRLEFVVE